MHHVLNVPDVSCEHCVAAIEGAVGTVDGVDRVDVDLQAKLVRVTGSCDIEAIVAAIDEAGYAVVGSA